MSEQVSEDDILRERATAWLRNKMLVDGEVFLQTFPDGHVEAIDPARVSRQVPGIEEA